LAGAGTKKSAMTESGRREESFGLAAARRALRPVSRALLSGHAGRTGSFLAGAADAKKADEDVGVLICARSFIDAFMARVEVKQHEIRC
jgi:hypothetical protein